MAAKLNIRKIVTALTWCVVGSGVLVLLVAAVRYRNSNVCKGYQIDVKGHYIDRKGIVDLLTAAGAAKGNNKPIASFDLRRLEAALEKNVWIKRAQLFFDNNGELIVNVTEREPAARVFTTEGSSFYVDSSGVQLPLEDKVQVNLPVFTGYPAPKIHLQGKDSALTAGILQISSFIRQDSFWSAQVAQVDITASRNFELEPEIGNHRVTFGDGSDIDRKFHRLFVFYKEVLSRTGFDKYSRIDVSYAGQVVGIRKGSEQSRYDSIQGMNNIRQLIASAQQLQQDTIRQQNVRPLERSTMTEQNLTNYDLLPADSETTKPTINKPARSPRAVMPKKP
ncbi:MAG: FtsQ-type POTRA domain-containing protein [Bacteroidetes bacterium]|nr:FtsQ-type POTRA domain-containing protein [Bacteroidota bacterium]